MRAEVDAYLAQLAQGMATAPSDLVALRDWYRASVQQMRSAYPPPPTDREWISGPGPDGSVRALLQTPPGLTELPVIVYFHGGGYALADPEATEFATASLALGARCSVLSVDYRLAPEHPFPAALRDAEAIVDWVLSDQSGLAVDPARVGLAGDSSGAALAVLAARRPACTVQAVGLIYGWFDLELSGESVAQLGDDDPVLPRVALEGFRAAAFGDDPDARAAGHVLGQDVAALPDCCLIVAGADPLRSDSERLAEQLRRAGIPTEYHCYDIQPHGFATVPFLTDGARAMAVLASFFATRLGARAA
jgi:acetyl esterase